MMRRSQSGFSLIELLIVVAIILTIAAIAIPNLMRSRMAANESATVGTMRTMTTALTIYTSIYPACGYPASLDQLKPGLPVSATQAGMLEEPLARDLFHKHGYRFEYTLVNGVGDCVGEPGGHYELEARPSTPNRTGVRGFFTDSSLVIRQDPNGDAGPSSPAI